MFLEELERLLMDMPRVGGNCMERISHVQRCVLGPVTEQSTAHLASYLHSSRYNWLLISFSKFRTGDSSLFQVVTSNNLISVKKSVLKQFKDSYGKHHNKHLVTVICQVQTSSSEYGTSKFHFPVVCINFGGSKASMVNVKQEAPLLGLVETRSLQR
jgi:hypothetical protein